MEAERDQGTSQDPTADKWPASTPTPRRCQLQLKGKGAIISVNGESFLEARSISQVQVGREESSSAGSPGAGEHQGWSGRKGL